MEEGISTSMHMYAGQGTGVAAVSYGFLGHISVLTVLLVFSGCHSGDIGSRLVVVYQYTVFLKV